ncbi:MAG TPA: sigma-70 family RNA polymerase sigma factor [Blastocatellia bacterium]|nr:sigma-70 family RNA polymerase sigma factor [Blastocatellia bacterium]
MRQVVISTGQIPAASAVTHHVSRITHHFSDFLPAISVYTYERMEGLSSGRWRESDLELSDTQIIERTLGGEPEAFNMLVRRWERHIYGLTLRMLGRDDEARDATQETFLSAYRNLAKFRGEAKFSSWIYRIALNICNTRLRDRPRGTVSLDEQREESGLEPAAEFQDLGGGIQQEQVTRLVRRALQALPAEMRQVIIMKEYEGLKFAEIADILGIPVSTVKTRMYTGLAELRKRLEHLRGAI